MQIVFLKFYAKNSILISKAKLEIFFLIFCKRSNVVDFSWLVKITGYGPCKCFTKLCTSQISQTLHVYGRANFWEKAADREGMVGNAVGHI